MRVVVFGAGAIGGLLAARLLGAGNAVLLVGRTDAVQAIRDAGLTVVGKSQGTFRPEASQGIPEGWAPELVVLTVKTPDVGTAAEEIGRQVRHPVPILALQNGLGVEDQVVEGLARAGWPDPRERVVRGINSYGAYVESPGRVHHAGDGEILLPAHPSGALAAAVDTAERLLTGAGLTVRRTDDLPRELWRKAVLNGAINPVTADHGVLNGELQKDPWRGQALRLLEEGRVAAGLAGHLFSREELEGDLWRVVRSTATNRSSMLQDLDHGRRTEIDSISGYLLLVAGSHGVDLPDTRRVIDRVRRRETAAQSAARRRGA